MNRLSRRPTLFVSALLMACQTAQAHELDGTWVNEAGSAVEIAVAEDGRLSGVYRTELGAPDAQEGFALTGWVQGDVVAFSVSFTGFGSITSWSGQMSEDEDGLFLRTLWHYTKDIPDADEAEDLWRTVNAGFAVFRPAETEAG
ncbi:MAG: avidin/streptavidin family protein [Litorimonas sp.]